MKSLILTLFLILTSTFTHANDQIASTIQHLSPHLEYATAKKYAIIIDKYSRKYDIDWKIPVVIFRQESNFRMDEVNYKTDDFGIGQLNYYWHIKKKEIDLKKLFNEPDYAIHETYKILYKLKKRYRTGAKGWYQWYTRYNSYRPYHRRRYYRQLYSWIKQVERYVNEQEKSLAHKRKIMDSRAN